MFCELDLKNGQQIRIFSKTILKRKKKKPMSMARDQRIQTQCKESIVSACGSERKATEAKQRYRPEQEKNMFIWT